MVSHLSWIHHLAFLTLFNFAVISELVQRSIHIIERSIKMRTVKVHSAIIRNDASPFFMNVTNRNARKLDAFMQDGLG